MRFSILAVIMLSLLPPLAAEDVPSKAKQSDAFQDPRKTTLYESIVDGSEAERPRLVHQSILIICWMPPPEGLPQGKFEAYQISGVDGYHSLEEVERFLDEFYKLEHKTEANTTSEGYLNVIVAGNNWGAGTRLNEKLKALTKKHPFSVFYAGAWAFRTASLIQEPEARLKLIRLAHDRATKSEQGADDRSATAAPSKAE